MSNIIFVTVLTICVAFVVSEPWTLRHSCGPNEEYSNCHSSAERDCLHLNRPSTFDCVSGCFCKDNSVRMQPKGPCIPEEWCPAALKANCSPTEVYTRGGKRCEPACRYVDLNNCHLYIEAGCVCMAEYLRHESAYCVDPKYCANDDAYERPFSNNSSHTESAVLRRFPFHL